MNIKKKPSVTFEKLEQSRKIIMRSKEVFDSTEVRSKKCPSCPFRGYPDGIGSEYGPESQHSLLEGIIRGQLSGKENTRVCHTPEAYGFTKKMACRGARNLMLVYFHGVKVLKQPTDECWTQHWRSIQIDNLKIKATKQQLQAIADCSQLLLSGELGSHPNLFDALKIAGMDIDRDVDVAKCVSICKKLKCLIKI